MLFRPGDNGNERAGVHQHPAFHLDFPKPSKWRRFVLKSFPAEDLSRARCSQ